MTNAGIQQLPYPVDIWQRELTSLCIQALCLPVLAYFVTYVVQVASKKEMSWVDAARIVTGMQNAEPWGNTATMDFVTDTGRAKLMAVAIRDDAIPVLVDRPDPPPAALLSLFRLRKKAFSKWLSPGSIGAGSGTILSHSRRTGRASGAKRLSADCAEVVNKSHHAFTAAFLRAEQVAARSATDFATISLCSWHRGILQRTRCGNQCCA